jgi:hypothetical protein
MFRIAVIALSLASPASSEQVPDPEGCVGSIEAIHDVSGRVGESNDGLGFLLRQIQPDVAYVANAMTQAERLIDAGEHHVEALITHCGSGVLDWAAEIRGALGDLRSYVEVGRLALPETDPRHPVWDQRRELEKAREAARAEFARIRAKITN